MENIIPFPRIEKPPPIDWAAIEAERLVACPKIPKKALKIIQKILEEESEAWHVMVTDTGDGYPPNPIPISRSESGVIWILDLLDRFGGELSYGSLHCKIRRSKKRLPVFLIKQVPVSTSSALCSALTGEFEHFVQSQHWQMLGKNLPDVDLMVVLIAGREANGERYVGIFDKTTIKVLFRHLGKGISIGDLIKWGL